MEILRVVITGLQSSEIRKTQQQQQQQQFIRSYSYFSEEELTASGSGLEEMNRAKKN